MMWEDVNNMWKDWRVYAVAAAITIAGLVYSCNKRFETGSYMQLSDIQVKESSHDCKSGECGCIKLNKENYQKFKGSLERMVLAGAHFSHRQMEALLDLANLNSDTGDAYIDDKETKQLCDNLLNPDSFMGKIALPYRGPEPVPKLPDPGKSNSPAFYGSPDKLEKYLVALTDENEDCSFSERESSQMKYKIIMAMRHR